MIVLLAQLTPLHSEAAEIARAAFAAKVVLQPATCKRDLAAASTGASDFYPSFVLPLRFEGGSCRRRRISMAAAL